VVQVSCFVHELDIGKAQEKRDDGKPVFQAKRNKNSRKPADNKNEIGPAAERLDPFKPLIGEKKIWLYVELVDPPVCCKPYNAD